KANTDEGQVVRDLQKAFRDDPGLLIRLTSEAPEDKEFAGRFNQALHGALDDDKYDRYAKPLLETGHLPLNLLMEFNTGINDDEQSAYKDIIALARDKSPAAVDEQHKLLYDQNYQNKVLGFLSNDERKVAFYALTQGELRPEDKLRSYMVGFGADK